jgi:diguanylate cyclase (GGDEF)-like protein
VKTLSEILGKTDFDFFSVQHAQIAFDDEQEIIRSGIPKLDMEEMETWPDGRITWCSTSKAPIRNSEGEIVGTLGVSRDITQQKLTQEALKKSEADFRKSSHKLAISNRNLAEANWALQELSFKDPLTQLWNRRFLVEQMPEDIVLAARAHRNLSENGLNRVQKNVDILFAMVDIDHFKEVNDRFGHLAGDLVLKQMGDILRGAARTSDMVARVGGEEFLIVARQTDRMVADVLAERIRASVESYHFVLDDTTTIKLTCSVGLSVYPMFASELKLFSWEQIVEIADKCLYAAKTGGRNAWVGIIPNTTRSIESYGDLPKDIGELVRSGMLPTITSLTAPLTWQ